MALDTLDIAVANSYTEETTKGMGAIKGSPCTVKSSTLDADGNTILTLAWRDKDNVEYTQNVTIQRGLQGDKGEKGEKGMQGDVGASLEATHTKDGLVTTITIRNSETHEVIDTFTVSDATMSFEDLTPEQKASLKGDKGDKGDKGNVGANAVDNGNGSFYLTKSDGTKTDDVVTVKGDKGDKGDSGVSINNAIDNGDGTFYFTKTDGSKTDDIATIRGIDGKDGYIKVNDSYNLTNVLATTESIEAGTPLDNGQLVFVYEE